MANKISFVPEYDRGDIVFLVSDPLQHKRVVVAYRLLPNDIVMYETSFDGYANDFYDFELSANEDIEYRQKHD